VDNSLNTLKSYNAIQDASMINYALKSYVDTSLNTNYTLKTYVDNSLNTLKSYNAIQDASMINYALSSYVDNSLNTLKSYNAIQDASMINYALKSYVDTSLNTNYTLKTYVDNSLNTLKSYNAIQDASMINYALKSYVDTSLNTNYTLKTYVDNSLNTLKTYNAIQDVSIVAVRTYVDTSLNANYYNERYIDASFANIITNSVVTTGSGTITAGGGFIGTSYQPSAITTAITFGNNITTGNITIGGSQTTGNLNLGTGTGRLATGNIFIGTGATATNTINIGRGNTISILNAAPSTFTLNSPITVAYNTSAITSNMQIGYQISDSSNGTLLPQNSTALVRTPGLTLPIGVWQVQIDMGYSIVTASTQYTVFQYGITTNINGNQASDCIPYARYRFDTTTSLSTGSYFNTASAIVSITASTTYYGIFKLNISNANPTSVATLTTFSIQATRLA